MSSTFQEEVREVLTEIGDMLVEKNKAYGDSALNPIRLFSKADAEEGINIRLDDKFSRLMRGHEFQGDDTINDVMGYLVLKKIAKNRKKRSAE